MLSLNNSKKARKTLLLIVFIYEKCFPNQNSQDQLVPNISGRTVISIIKERWEKKSEKRRKQNSKLNT